MSVEKQVNDEAIYGIVPLLHKERIYGFWDIVLVTGGYAIATWCYVQGGYIASMIGLKQVLTNTIFGMLLSGLILMLTIVIPTRHGIDVWIYQRALFGYKGVLVLWFIAMASTWGYEAINAKLYAGSIMKLFTAATGVTLSDSWTPWIGITCILIGWYLAIKGPAAVKKSTYIMVPSLLLVGVFIMYMVFSRYSLSELMAMKPVAAGDYKNPWEAYALVMEWNLAFMFSWYPVMGVLPRLVKTERKSYWGHLIGYAGIYAWFICIGALTGLAMSQTTGVASVDPTEWLITLGGPWAGSLSLIFIGIANITTQAVATYSLTVSTKVVRPDWNYKKIATAWTVWCIILVFWGGIWDYYQTFLSIVGVVAGPAIGLILTDFYIVRKQKFSMRDLFKQSKGMAYYYTKGFNIPVAISFLAGVFVYFAVYDPINLVARNTIFMYTTATALSTVVSVVVYLVLSWVKPINEYLLKDRKMKNSFNAGSSIES